MKTLREKLWGVVVVMGLVVFVLGIIGGSIAFFGLQAETIQALREERDYLMRERAQLSQAMLQLENMRADRAMRLADQYGRVLEETTKKLGLRPQGMGGR
jgi:hypothetical protein